MNQKGFANIVLIILVVVLAGALGYVMLVKKPASVEQPQTNNLQNSQSTTPPPSNNAVVQNPPANISQLTKAQVLNGYDQCGIQFSNGEISIGYDKYTQLEQTCSAAVSGASICGALYVFKNINGTARVVDSVIIGKENIKIVSVNKDVIVGKTDGAMGYTSTTKIYKFVNGKLIAQ